jgi:hypothetical protein
VHTTQILLPHPSHPRQQLLHALYPHASQVNLSHTSQSMVRHETHRPIQPGQMYCTHTGHGTCKCMPHKLRLHRAHFAVAAQLRHVSKHPASQASTQGDAQNTERQRTQRLIRGFTVSQSQHVPRKPNTMLCKQSGKISCSTVSIFGGMYC